jgi:hypothetical protein
VAREYTPGLARILEPIQRLAGGKEKDISHLWGAEQDEALELLKVTLTTVPVLRLPDPRRKYKVHCDACKLGRGLGALLLQQDDDGKWYVVAYWSRSLTRQERHRSVTRLEGMAFHDSVMHWQVYLRYQEFEVVTDHYALVYLVTKYDGDPHGCLHRMCVDLQVFRFSVSYRKGTEHLDADAMSRLFQRGDDTEFVEMDEYRSDHSPLTDEEIDQLERIYKDPGDAAWLKSVIRERRAAEKAERDQQEQTQEGQEERIQARTARLMDGQEEWRERREVRHDCKPLTVRSMGITTRRAAELERLVQEAEQQEAEAEARQQRGEAALQAREAADIHIEVDVAAAELVAEEMLRTKLEDYDGLHQRVYLHPTEKVPYEVVSVYMDKRKARDRGYRGPRRLLAMAKKIHPPGSDVTPEQQDEVDEREINGIGGTMELVRQFEEAGMLGMKAIPESQRAAEWLRLQMEDSELAELIALLPTASDRIYSDRGAHDYFFRAEGEHGEPGPLYRQVERDGVTTSGDTRVRVTRIYRQLMVPESLQRSIIELFHEGMAHPGARRTLRTIQLYYWWSRVRHDVKRHAMQCRACQTNKVDNRRTKVPVQAYASCTLPFYRVHLDGTAPMPTTP